MKKIIISGIVLSLLYSCGSTKSPEGETSIEVPCTGKDYTTDNKSFKVSGQGSANAAAGAIKVARRKAETQLISDIKSAIALVSDQYEEIIEDGEIGEYTSLTKDFSRKIAYGSLKNIRVICEKTTRVSETGMVKHYISLEMSTKDIVDDYIESISNSKKNSIRSNSEKMRKIFDDVLGNN